MPDQTGYTGALNIIDVDDLTAVTDVTTITGIWVRIGGTTNRKITGQALADSVIQKAQISALSQLASASLDAANDKVYIYDASANAWKYILASALTSSVSHDSLTSGTVTAKVVRSGGSATTISNPAAGEYTLTVQTNGHLQSASIYGNNTTLNGSNEMLVRINNSANSRDRRVSVQIYDASNGALVDAFSYGVNHTQAVTSNVTLLTIPGLNGFGSAGFYIEIT